MAIIGIDLGTTNSLGTVYRNGKVELIPNRYGSYLTPSVVNMDDEGKIIVGEMAKERLITAPMHTVASFKKDMGTNKQWTLGNRTFLPEELSSFIIQSIVDDAKAYLNEEIEEAIISVPAYFYDAQRVATKRAGTLANIKVNRIINEPSAAALASYLDSKEEQLFLIFDFGGGTLDVSIVDCFGTIVEILSVAGNNKLGGDNFNELIADSFLKEHQLDKTQISNKEYAVCLHQAEQCKKKLTDNEKSMMNVCIQGTHYQSEYTNKRLLNESGMILKQIKDVLSHALRDGDVAIEDLDQIIMVGGSSKMPLIQSYLNHLFGRIPVVSSNCDEMIALGLGYVCAIRERNEDIKDYVLTDICPFTLGTNIKNDNDPNHAYMSPIVGRNSVLPCSRVERFCTSYDYQPKINLQILQGEHVYASDNQTLGKMSVSVPRKKAGKEAIDVRFTYDVNGILIVDVTVVSTGKKVTKVITQNMNDEEIKAKATELEKLKVHPKDLDENKLVLEKLEALFQIVPPYLRDQMQIMIRQFEYYLNKQNPRLIRNYRNYINQVIKQIENYDPFASVIELDEYEEDDDEKDGDSSWIN